MFKSGLTLLAIVVFSLVANADDKVGKVESSSAFVLPESRIAYINPVEGAIYEVDLAGHVTWKYKIPRKLALSGSLRKGADIEWLEGPDHFLFVIPESGIYEVNRQKKVVWSYETTLVSHDADRLPNGNTIFVNAWDGKKDNQVVEITTAGKIVFKWKISDSGISCAHKTANCYRPKRPGGPAGDYTHVNGVEKFKDGSFLVSLRNLHKVVVIDKDLRVIERHRQIRAVHDPRLEGGKLIAIARRRGIIARDRQKITSREDSSQIFNYQNQGYTFLRTNERISPDLVLLTDSTHLLIFDRKSEKIVWKLKLEGFGDQREEKYLPFLYKAVWVGEKEYKKKKGQ